MLLIFLSIIFTNLAALTSLGQESKSVGFEDGEGHNSYFNRSSGCEVVESSEGNGNRALVMPISPTGPATVFACVCGQGGDISFKYKQPSTIADFWLYQEGSSNSIKCDDSRELVSSPVLSVGPGKHKLIWKYKFRESCTNSATRSTALIDDIQFRGELGLCDCSGNLNDPPIKPRVEGPTATTVGCKTNFKDSINKKNILYEFNWGDGSCNITECCLNNQEINESHIWMKPGKYQIVVTAIDNNIRSIPQNISLDVKLNEEFIYYPGYDLENKLKNASYTIFYLENGHYYKTIDISPNTNNIIIKSFPNSDEFGTVIDAGSEGTYCFNLSGVSNISIENIMLINGNTSIIMNKCRNITISGNKLSNYREIGINATSSSSILIKNNLLKSDCSECRGIVLIDSNSNTNHQSIIRNNSFDMPSNCLSLKLKNSCGNKIYLSKSINYFRENNVECGLINSSQAVKYVCKNNREFEFDPSTDITQENFCNDLMLGV